MKHLFVVNPSAGKGTMPEKLKTRIFAVCDARGADYEIYDTIGVGDAERYLRKVCEEYQNSGEINFRVEDKKGAMDEIRDYFMSQEKATAYMDFDGYRVEFPDWWFNIRPSNTEPYLRFLCEATSKELLDEKVAKVKEILTKDFCAK